MTNTNQTMPTDEVARESLASLQTPEPSYCPVCEPGNEAVGLTVYPAQVSLTGATNTVIFTVRAGSTNSSSGLRPLSLPLEWSVSNPALGVIVAAEGYSAGYAATSEHGINVVTVMDQYRAEGFAVIRQ